MQLISAKCDFFTKSSATYVIYFRRLSHISLNFYSYLSSVKKFYILEALKEMNQNILENSFSAGKIR